MKLPSFTHSPLVITRYVWLAKLMLALCMFTIWRAVVVAQDDAASEPVETQEAANSPWSLLKADPRLGEPRSLDSYFPFQTPTSLEQWEPRRAALQGRLRTVLGLEPEPPRTPLNVVISEPLVLDGYSVAKVRFESMPGFFVTGSLYRPLDDASHGENSERTEVANKRPGILCPHGHWYRGRFMYANDDEVQRELDSGAEIHESAARSPLQARCVHLARMGCVVFHYDMLGNADSVQISSGIAHGYSKPRPHLEAADSFGLYSVRAESNFHSIMGLQTWNTIRSLDFLETLADVDPQRIGVTGASGGGTQTFIVSAIDPRVAVSFPAVMVGTAMQGGCVCENCSFLRVESGNVEFAALFAPKPLGLSAADDWTKEMETKGFPELRQLYSLYGVEDQVELDNHLEFGHNYNQFGRRAMYRLMARNFGLPDFPERPFQVLRDHEMSWLISDNSGAENAEPSAPEFQPEVGEAFEVKLLQWWQKATSESWNGMLDELLAQQGDPENLLLQWRARMRGIYLGNQYRVPTKLKWLPISGETLGGDVRFTEWLLVDNDSKQMVPVVAFQKLGPANESAGPFPGQSEQICVFISDSADSIMNDQAQFQPWAQERLDAGQQILCVDLLGQGRFVTHAEFKIDDRWRMTKRESAGYVMGYNLPLVSHRAQDVLQVLAAILPPHGADANNESGIGHVKRLDIVANGAGVPAVSVSALAWDLWGGSKHETEVDGQTRTCLQRVELRDTNFRFADVPSLRDENFLPGVAIIGDLPGLWLLNQEPQVVIETTDPQWQRVNQVRTAVGYPPLHMPTGGN